MESRCGEPLKTARRGGALAALASLAALAAYARVLFADGLVWDDRIVARWQIPLFSSFRDLFFLPAGVPNLEKAYYRPLVWASYRLESLFATPGSAAGILLAHSTNLLLHALATFLVFRLALTLFGEGAFFPALASALLFALHPVHAESVCAIAGRTDLLAAVFVLGALLAALAYGQRGGAARLLGTGLLFFGALLSKEVAAGGLPVLPLLWLAAGRGGPKRFYAAAGAFAVGSGAWILLRALAGASHAGAVSLPSLSGLAETLGHFLYRVFFPWPKALYPQGGLGAVAALAVCGLALAATIAAVQKSGRSRPVFLLWGWFFFFAAPAFGARLLGVTANPVADRYLYLPSVAACLLAGYCLQAWAKEGRARNVAMALFLLVCVAFGATSVARAGYWQNDRAFWSAAIKESGASRDPVALANYAIAERDAGNFAAAREYAQRAGGLFAKPGDRVKAAALVAEIDAREALELAKKGDAAGALSLSDAALVGISEAYRGGPIPTLQRLSVATALLARAEALSLLGRFDGGVLVEALANVEAVLLRLPGDAYAQELKERIEKAAGRAR